MVGISNVYVMLQHYHVPLSMLCVCVWGGGGVSALQCTHILLGNSLYSSRGVRWAARVSTGVSLHTTGVSDSNPNLDTWMGSDRLGRVCVGGMYEGSVELVKY